jgi:hypothetical protein
MSRSSALSLFLLLGLAAAPLRADRQGGLPDAGDSSYMGSHSKAPKLDQSALRDEVDETQGLLDSLARETRRLDKKDLEPLFKSLRDEYHLDDYVGKARKFVEEAEEVLDVQDAIKVQQDRVKAASPADADQESSKLLGLQSDLVGSVDRLRDTLREVHSNATEDNARDLRNWIMISEGLLRRHREDAEAKAAALAAGVSGTAGGSTATAAVPLTATAEEPLSAAGVTPPAEASSLTPTPPADR